MTKIPPSPVRCPVVGFTAGVLSTIKACWPPGWRPWIGWLRLDISRSGLSIWPDVIVAPYLVTGTTDSRWYRNLSDAIYRFIPMEVSSLDMQGVHGFNESISLDAWGKSVDFLVGIIRNSQRGGSE
jgi:hypothetical protein